MSKIKNIARLPTKSFLGAILKLTAKELQELLQFLTQTEYVNKEEKIFFVMSLLSKFDINYIDYGDPQSVELIRRLNVSD